MTRSKFGIVSPSVEASLRAHQATATAQADRWTRQRIREYLEDVAHLSPPAPTWRERARTYDPAFARRPRLDDDGHPRASP